MIGGLIVEFQPNLFDVRLIKKAFDFAISQENCALVYKFEDSPLILRELFSGDGDEEYIVICKGFLSESIISNGYLPYWIESMGSCQKPMIWKTSDYLIIVLSH